MPSGVELAVGYVSLVAETGDMKKQIAQAFGQVDAQASKAGKNVGKNLFAGAGADAAKAGNDVGDRFSKGVKQALGAAGLVASAATVVAGIRQVFDAGLGFEKTANNFQAVTRATTAEMEQMRAKARELGNDVSITGASASDALAAMTELAKGGFTVQQSMDGARGTLQLAAAAQIDAAEAAAIQSAALLAFGKDAGYAATAADVLANAANASAADIPDVAYALQAAGTVANQFGLSMEDTVATISLFANAGIKGSDAGTLLKSALLALTDQSNPAQGAIAELGLQVYNANGEFVGMHDLFGQLQYAAGRMSPEMYQAATNVLFGSDAARLAGVAAQQGADGWDAMRDAVARQGAAAEVAAAQTQGLPGVMERLSNTAESAKLALFGLADGPAQAAGTWVNDLANDALAALEAFKAGDTPDWMKTLVDVGKDALPALKALGGTVADVVKVLGGAALKTAAEAFHAIGAVVGTVVVPALEAMAALLEGNGDAVAAVAVAFAAWKYLPGLLTAIGTPLQNIGSKASTAAVTGLKSVGETAVSTASALKGIATANDLVAGKAGASATQMGRFGSVIGQIGTHIPVVQRMQTAFINGAVGAERFGRTVGVAQATMTGFRSAGSAVANLFGGPWGAALAAAAAGVTLWSMSVSDANQRAKSLEQSTTRIVDASRDMYDAFAKSGGDVDDTVIGKVNDQVNALYDTIETQRKGASIADWFKSAAIGIGSLGLASGSLDASSIQETAEATEQMLGSMRQLGLTSQSISSALYSDNGAWEILAANLNDAGEGGQRLLRHLQPLRAEFENNRAAAMNLTPGAATLEEAIGTLADTTSDAEQKTNALRTALDVLAGKQPDVQEATAQYNETIQQVAEGTKEAWDAADGYGAALVNADGTVNTSTANGLRLYKALEQIKDATTGVAGAGGDLKAAFSGNAEQFAALATAAGLTTEQVAAMSREMGLVPSTIETLVALNGATDTQQQVTLVGELLAGIPAGQTITIDALNQDAIDKLRATGVQVDEFKAANGQTQLRITATGQAAIDELGRVRAEMNMLIQGTSIRGTWDAVAAPGQGRTPGPQPFAPGYVPYDPSGGRAKGGPITGPGPKGRDSVPIMAAPGEHMLTASDVDKLGGQPGVYAFRAMLQSGALPGFEGGGAMPGSPGGSIAAIDAAFNQAGLPYQYGEFDCSMYMSQIYAAMAGLPPGRYFNTETDFEALGFKKGFKPGALNIGIRRGGGGPNSHMAGTLPNGINVENTGGGSMYGTGATGADQFPIQYYFEAPNGGDMGAMQMGSMLADGQLGATHGMLGGAAPGAADPYATGSATAPGRTEGYIPAGAGNTSVSGTSMVSGFLNMGAQAINGLIDQAASAASTAAGAAVAGGTMGAGAPAAPAASAAAQAAIGLGTQAAKRGVEYGFQLGGIWTDALIEQVTPFGAPRWLSTDPTAFIPRLPSQGAATTSAEQATTAAVDPATTQHGQSMPTPPVSVPDVATGQGGGALPGPASAPTPAQTPLSPQSPTDVMPPWMRNIGVFDDGGWLEPGKLAYNAGNRPEPVFNPRDWDALKAGVYDAPPPAGGDSAPFIENMTVTAADTDDAIRKWRGEVSLASMRYRGRP